VSARPLRVTYNVAHADTTHRLTLPAGSWHVNGGHLQATWRTGRPEAQTLRHVVLAAADLVLAEQQPEQEYRRYGNAADWEPVTWQHLAAEAQQ